MSNFQKIFKRKEIKYKLSFEHFESFKEELLNFMKDCGYGLHQISSLYYDTKSYDFALAPLFNPSFKEKFRVRSYGQASKDKDIFLELKKKFKGITYKRRISQNFSLFEENFPQLSCEENFSSLQIKKEIEYFVKKNSLEPKILISYDRLAFQQKNDENFRVTFDFDIKFKLEDLDLTKENSGQKVDEKLEVLMEVKAANSYPLFFTQLLSKYKIYPSSFSKYSTTFQNHILKENYAF